MNICRYSAGGRFAVIDVENANNSRKSVCQVGVVIVEGDQVVEQKSWFVKPPEKKVGGYQLKMIPWLRDHDFSDDPTLAEVWPSIWEMISDDIVVGHGIKHDIDSLRHSLAVYGVTMPTVRYIDSHPFAEKHAYKCLKKTGIASLAEFMEVEHDAHDALSDALVTAEVLTAGAVNMGYPNLITALDQTGFNTGVSSPETIDVSAWMEKRMKYKNIRKEVLDACHAVRP